MNAEPLAATDVEDRLSRIPAEPGVYLLRDRHRKVIYVGKAKNLRSRVRTYFRGGDERLQVRVPRRAGRADVETLVTRNEKEALILENNLIKQYKPRYNIRLKDDKSYVSVKVTVDEEWPRVLVTRKIVRDKSRYFGPFHSAWAVRETPRHHPQGVPAPHLHGHGVPQPQPAVSRVSDQALPRARAVCRSTVTSMGAR